MRFRLFSLWLCTAVGACSDGCDNEIVQTATSPDGARDAILFQRDCGATTGSSIQASIVRRGEVPSENGNVFIADIGYGAAGAARWGGPWAELSWLDAHRLRVRHDAGARTFVRAERIGDVRILYDPI